MANYQLLKADIDEKVYENAQQKITGENLNAVLNAMVTTLGAEYQFAGVATIDTNPETTDAKVFYIANGKGTYTNFGGLEVTEDEVVILYYDTAWHKVATGIASNDKLTELESKTGQQFEVLHDTLFTNNNIVVAKYVLKQGYMLRGTAQSDVRWVYDDRFIPIVNGETIVLAGNTYGIGIDYYNANKEPIGNYWNYYSQQGIKLFSVDKENVAFMKISYTNGESLSPNTFSPVVIQRSKDNIYLKVSEFSINQINLSVNTLTFSSSPTVVYEGVEYAQISTYSIPSAGSALKNLVFNTISKELSIKDYNNIDIVNDKVLGYFIINNGNIYAHNLPFLFSVNGVYNIFDGDNVPLIRFGNNMNTLPNIDTVRDIIEFPAMCSVIYSGKDYPLNNYSAANVPIGVNPAESIMKMLVFDKIAKQIVVIEYNQWQIQQYPLGWLIYDPNTKLGSYHFPFDITIDGKNLNSDNKSDTLGFIFKDKIDYQGHMFMRFIGKDSTDPIIPSQTIFDVQLCARLGIKSIEANCLGTATKGKYVVMHGGDPNYADVGYQLVLKKSVYDTNPSAFPIPEGETLVPYGDDAYYYPWDNIPNTSYDRLRNSYFNRSQYPKYRVPITELTEFLTECNKYNIMPIVTYVDSAQLQLIKQIMGNNYAIRNDNRVSDALHIYWDGTNRTSSEILEICNRYKPPFMYGMGVNVARQKTDEQLKEIVTLLHDNGYLIVSDVNYYTEEDGQRLKDLGFDGQTTDWNIPFKENGNILNCSADINFNDYNTNGVVTDGTLVLSDTNTVSSKNNVDSMQVSKAQLAILYNGSIDITFGEISMQRCISNGENTLVLTSKLINRVPSFNIKANGTVRIYNIIYKVSKC